ncbi:uncharacterized protein FFM5_15333 [Fusarium fujikuroi]|nr:uncharacterized protein FFM5_15333 [Fusarium fujikuroi]
MATESQPAKTRSVILLMDRVGDSDSPQVNTAIPGPRARKELLHKGTSCTQLGLPVFAYGITNQEIQLYIKGTSPEGRRRVRGEGFYCARPLFV